MALQSSAQTLICFLFFLRWLIPITADEQKQPPTYSNVSTFGGFQQQSRCDLAGILEKLQSWGHERSDTIEQELIPLAKALMEYSALHSKILKGWKDGDEVSISANASQKHNVLVFDNHHFAFLSIIIQTGKVLIYSPEISVGFGNRMFGAAASFLLAFFTERAFFIEWKDFRDEDGPANEINKHTHVPLSDFFHLPCFEWSLNQTSIKKDNRTRTLEFHKIWNRAYELAFNGVGDPWSNTAVIKVRSWHDFSAAALLNPSFKDKVKLFPLNPRMSALQPEMPTPLTLAVRYLFSPNVGKYHETIRNDFDRLQMDVREKCPGSRFNGLHLRLRSHYADRKAKSYFPCLEKLMIATGEDCFFVASDSAESQAIVYPHLPKNAKIFSYNLSRARNTAEGLQSAVLELFTLGSARIIYGFEFSTYSDTGGVIQGVGPYGVDCEIRASPNPAHLCRTDHLMNALKLRNGIDVNEMEQRRRFGCILLEQKHNLSNPARYNWDKNRDISACVVVYVNSTQMQDLKKLLLQLEGKFYSVAGRTYPIVIISQDLPVHVLGPLKSFEGRLDMKFVVVKPWKLPDSLESKKLEYNIDQSHLNRFFSGAVYKHPALMKYTYCMRLDIGILFKEQFSKDPFVQMVEQGLNYGYIAQNSDGHMKGLDEVTRSFIRDSGIRPQSLHYNLGNSGELAQNQFVTKVEVVRLEFFRNSKYMDYVNAVDKANGFYTSGWEDGLIKSVGLALTANPSTVGDFASFIKLV